MFWVYILKSSEGKIYVGETSRLFSRLRQHKKGSGSKTTSVFKLFKLLGVYKVKYESLLFDMDNKEDNKQWSVILENRITLMCMKRFCWTNVFGGKYHEGFRPEDDPSKKIKYLRPFCWCGLPADLNEFQGKIYWRCCKKNRWDSFDKFLRKELKTELSSPCGFYSDQKSKS